MAFLNNTGLATQISTIKAYVQSQISVATSVLNTSLNTSIATMTPVGTVQAFAGSIVPEGWLLCDGSAISRTTYAALFNTIGNTYGGGDGETTFNLPDLIDKFIEGSSLVGTEKAAGLPNITAYVPYLGTGSKGADSVFSGALARESIVDGVGYGTSGGWMLAHNITFDASRSSAIYGSASTVQPPAVTMKYIIKY